MGSPEQRPQNEVQRLERLKARIITDMQDQGLKRLSDTVIQTMAEIIISVRDAQTAGDVRGLLGNITNTTTKILMRSLPMDTTPISDDEKGREIRRSTARLLAEEAFGNGRHAQSPRLIPYCIHHAAPLPPSSQGRLVHRGPSL